MRTTPMPCHPALPLAAALVLAGCKPLEVIRDPSPAASLEGSQTIRLVVEEAIGPAPLQVPVRALNGYGVPVASVAQSVDVDGTPTSVSFDGWGYGYVELTEPGTHEIATSSATVEAHVVDSDWSGFGLLESWRGPTDDEAWLVRPVSTGMVVAGRQHVWWVGPGERPQQVLTAASGEIQGLRTGDLDTDGILDALTWTSEEVYLLRGRPEGGMSWGMGISATGYAVAGADIGDVSDDSLPDVVVAWSGSENNNWVDVWESDGLWNYEPVPPRLMQTTPTDVGIGDNTGEGVLQITATNDELSWSRFIEGADTKYIPIGPQLDLNVPPDATVETGWDMNNDGGDELMFIGPRFESQVREILIFDFIGTNPEYLTLSPLGAWVDVSDTNDDGFGDVMQLMPDGALQSLSHVAGSYSTRQSGEYVETGAFSMTDLDRDEARIPEMLIAGAEQWRWYEGSQNTDGSESWWTDTQPSLGNPGQRVDSIPIAAELDGNPSTVDIVGIEIQTGVTSLVVWTHSPSSPTSSVYGAATLSNVGAPPLDLALCDDVAWALLNGSLVRVSLAGQPQVTGSIDTTASRVACGSGPFSSRATLLEPSELVYLDNALNVLGTEAVSGAEDIAVADGEVGVCDTEGCSIETFGSALVVGGEAEEVMLLEGDTETALGVTGVPSVVDVDDDGNLDVLVATAHDVSVLRSTGEGLGPVESWHSPTELLPPATAGDITGDGAPDLWSRQANGELIFTEEPDPWVPVEDPSNDDTGM